MERKPNIIFIFSDQQRWDTLGCYGQRLDITPNLDQMAKEGTLFENTFTCQPVCGPARACLQTGLYATQLRTFRNGIALPQDQLTIAKQLSKNNYSVGYIGKWHLASNHGESDVDIGEFADFHSSGIPLERRGGYKDFWLASDALEHTSHSYDGHMFDAEGNKVVFPENRYRVDAVTDYVIDYIKSINSKSPTSNGKQQKPFFLFVSYIEPHHQNDHQQYEGPIGSKEQFKNFQVPGDLIGTAGDWKEQFPDYLGCCHSLDENVGRIRKTLDELGLRDNTIIVYTSDHGSHFKTRNSEYKRSCHDGCIRIPLVIYGGPFTGGKKMTEMVSLIDLPKTVLNIAGVEPPSFMQGNSLLKLVKEPSIATSWPDHVFLQISETQVGRAIRTKKWKYSVRAPEKNGNRYSKSKIYIEDFLYDLEKDPHERTNLVAEPQFAKVREDLRVKLLEEMKKACEELPTILPQQYMPKDGGIYLSYKMEFDENKEAILLVRLNPGSEPIPVPIGDILEEILDVPLIINIKNNLYRGLLILKDDLLYLKELNGHQQRFSQLISDFENQEINFISLNPSESELKEEEEFTPKYTLLVL